ncbi:LytR/AlgR family response regulator transcription factor [Aureivirga sp. CE67]|uniref:LytR/AlgR family response regulator transcription factor n=1 Tax=Aureivirga sp. CE67 TaxID=1788983 RepID=UPI0018C9F659|nr:LytTR family DNA-binding domain-containing protein [Aureivirga sp. CE67]
MDIIIIEDEKPAARRLKRLLEDFGLHTNTMLHSVKESIEWFQANKHPDLIFLDIQLSDGLSFEIFEEVDITSSIIFTTAYDEYALKAFKLNSIDYLLKPIDDDELEVAIEKYKKNNQIAANPQIDLSQIQQLLSNPFEKNYKKRFTVKVGQHLKVIQVSDIECFYSENKSTYIYTNEKRNYLLDIPLEQLESQLEDEVFFRVNRKFFVNINAIKDIVSYTNSRLKLILENYNEEEIIVSREKVKKFKEWLG